jgi:signal transduction histidine kinase
LVQVAAHLGGYDAAMPMIRLHEFIALHREEIILRCRATVATRSVPPPTHAEIDHGVPLFLDQLVDALRRRESNPEIRRTAGLHGHDLLLQGFTVSQVVQDYGDVCQTVTGLAGQMDALISADDFRMLNRCLDEAIAGAVTQYGRDRNQAGIDGESARGNERLGFFAHELRNLVRSAIVAFEAVKAGSVGVAGSTGTLLQRSLIGLDALVGRSLAEVRLTQGIQHLEHIIVSEFIEELALTAALGANARAITFNVVPVEQGVVIEADRQVLAAAVGDLLHNAFKFTGPSTIVTLRVVATVERVRIEIQDECGGLPCADATELFRPFEHRTDEGAGFGLGLAFSRWAVEANHGRIYARTLPDKGCVFTVDLARVPVRAVAIP